VPSVSWHVVLASAAAVALDNVHANAARRVRQSQPDR